MNDWKLEPRRRSFLQASAALAFSAAFATGCGILDQKSSNGVEGKKGGKFLLSFDALDIDFYVNWEKGGRAAAEALGLTYAKSVSNYDVSVQRSAFEDAVVQGIQAVGMTSPDEGATPSLIQSLAKNNIFVANNGTNAPWNTPFDNGSHHIAYHAPDNYLAARQVAKVLFDAMGGSGKLVHIEGVRGLSHDTERTLGLDSMVEEYPGIQLVARQPGNYNRADAQGVMENILNAHPDVAGVFVQNDDGALGVMSALQSVGHKALVTGMDGMPEMLSKIQSGEALATWVQDPSYQAGLQAVLLFDALNGWSPRTPERMMMPGTFIIDSPKAAELYKKLLEKGSLYDWSKMSRTLHPDDWDMQNLMSPIDPNEFWARRIDQKPAGYVLPSEFQKSKDSGEWESVTHEYAEFKVDPLSEVRAATNYGGAFVGTGQ